ncbi:BSD domain-containing 1 [Brachionus plicatilis]|uniref:BSD domain-containing 1 n=1 Tax=Brachionus plicatilis TaxID=10195 RepID=A0A3M7QSH6_BRAPC|nr:BSD domain-containing 1 [Brachionus plicatilis]
MSESDKSSKSNWWENLVKSAKDKSINAIEVIKGDLAEFKSTMSNDASNLFLSSNKSNNDMSESNSESFLKSIAKSFNEIKNNLNLSDESCTSSKTLEENKIPNNSMNERLRKEIENLKCDEGTYKIEPMDPGYSKWMQVFDPDEFKEEISKLLIENSTMRLIYSQMVPANLSNVEFWARYFFRLNLLNEEHMKRIKLIEKADSEIHNEKGTDWDDEDENFEDSNTNHSLIENETNSSEAKILKIDTEDTNESNQISKSLEGTIDANQSKIKNDESKTWYFSELFLSHKSQVNDLT